MCHEPLADGLARARSQVPGLRKALRKEGPAEIGEPSLEGEAPVRAAATFA